ncbi:MAG: hypothetical protein K2X77_31655 [Candidatus Obscuribacterales bacterium]|nr:hypothetical protein [Candidatus Obscuribacterales bacterium]
MNRINAVLSMLMVSLVVTCTAICAQETPATQTTPLHGVCRELSSSKDQIILISDDANWTQESTDTISLEEGEILVATKEPVHVKTSSGSVELNRDAVALVQIKGGAFTVTNLSTFNKKSLRVIVEGKLIEPNIGMQVMFTADKPTYRRVFQNPKVGQWAIVSSQLSEETWLTVSNPSLNEILEKDPMVAQLSGSQQPKSQHKLWDRIAKTAACISAVAGSNEKFSHLKQ